MSDETDTGTTGIEMPDWLSDLFECAISAATLEELLNCLVSTIAREMQASEGSIMLLNEDKNQLSIGAARRCPTAQPVRPKDLCRHQAGLVDH